MPPTIFKGLPIAPLLALALTVVPLTCAATIETLTSPTLEIAVSQTGGTTFSDNLTKRNKSQRMAQNYAKDPTTPSTLLHKNSRVPSRAARSRRCKAQEAGSDSDGIIPCREFLDRKRNDAR